MGSVPHRSVFLEKAIEFLKIRPEGLYLDATVGAGGHSAAIAGRLTSGTLIGLDRDEAALRIARESLGQFGTAVRLEQEAFSRFAEVLDHLQIDRVDGVLADLGVSSMQFDDPMRGFSFHSEVPLDMRMDRSEGETAGELLSRISERELALLIGRFGQERFARRIARRIVRERAAGTVFTGRELHRIIHEAIPGAFRRKRGIDPATQTFMGLRIALNRELEELEAFLPAAIKRCTPGARIVVIAFHSLEDRIVKRQFRAWERPWTVPTKEPVSVEREKPLTRVLTKKPLMPGEEDIAANPRCRSARLRAVEVI